jgi:DNA-binding transcriptional LysR family regulator
VDLLAHLTTFARIVEAKSLSAAARSLGLSLPAVSRQLRALEEELGASLVIRSTRRLSLTDRGRALYEAALRIQREVEEARERVRPGADVRGRLVVSASVTIAMTLVLPRLPALLSRHPALRVDLRLEDRLVDFVAEGVDVAVRGGAPPPDSTAYAAVELVSFRRVLVASPAYVRARGAPRAPEDLLRHACLTQPSATRWPLSREGSTDARVEIDVTGPLQCGAPVALLELARAGVGVALLPEWLVARDLAARALRRVLSSWASEPVRIWAVHRVALRGAPAVRALLEVLRGIGETGAPVTATGRRRVTRTS